jgi:hypothetical protein
LEKCESKSLKNPHDQNRPKRGSEKIGNGSERKEHQRLQGMLRFERPSNNGQNKGEEEDSMRTPISVSVDPNLER